MQGGEHFVAPHLEFAATLLIGEVFGVATYADSTIVGVVGIDLKLGHDRVFAALQHTR